MLEQRGFRSVILEELTVVQQTDLMATASVVVAPHGAGLTNITFCKPVTMVVEIFAEYMVPCYWALSTLANLMPLLEPTMTHTRRRRVPVACATLVFEN